MPKRVLILDGAATEADPAARAAARVADACRARGDEVEVIALRELSIGPCVGCFGCWVKTPGECVIKDDAAGVTRAMIAADTVVFVSPVTFGALSPEIKGAMDRSICLVTPYFTMIAGETHHRLRYPRYPSFLALGVQAEPDAEAGALFRQMIARNAVNLHCPRWGAWLLPADAGEARTEATVAELLSGESGAARKAPPLPSLVATAPAEGRPVRRVVTLLGTPRAAAKSNSESLASYLGERLTAAGAEIATFQATRALRDAEATGAMIEAVLGAELVVLAAPLYVDALPAPLLAALKLIAARAATREGPRPLLTAVINCGFPEAQHCDSALAVGRQFAREVGFPWAGGVALGGGEALGAKPLHEVSGMARKVTRALDLAAEALAAGRALPEEADRLMRSPMFPAWLYRFMGTRGFTKEARANKVDRPLDYRAYPQ
jgi:NAD(P)H-dependent FMN reductase